MTSQILQRISPLEIATAVIMYIVVRSIVWCLRQSLRITERAFKKETQRVIHRHVHDKHGGLPTKCSHKDCESIGIVTGDLLV